MIIKSSAKKTNYNLLKFLLPLFMVATVVYFYTQQEQKNKDASIICGAEETDSENKFIVGDKVFGNGQTQSSEQAYRGRHSSYVTPEDKYSISYDYTDFSPGDKIEVTAWTKSPALEAVIIAAHGEDSKTFYVQSDKVYTTDKGWSKKRLLFQVPIDKEIKKLKLFAYYSSDLYGAYIDDFTVRNVTEHHKGMATLNSSEVQNVHLHFDVKAMDKLKKIRENALNLGLLVKSDDDWVKAKLSTAEIGEVDIKARLKGDWTDHLKGNFWSFRIKMPSDKSWKRMQTFSVQNPQTRDNLSEWVFHKFLEAEDVLTPRYDFVRIRMNDQDPRTYAYEEHFEKQIVEYKNRREGVIIRYSEEENWDLRRKDKINSTGTFHHTPELHRQAPIEPFGGSKVSKNPKLSEQYEEAANLLYGFQQYELTAAQVFDIDRLAKYYAICEVMQAYHSTIWHNMRYYYNPIIRKLEPIGFDGFTDSGVYDWHGNAFYGAYRSSDKKSLAVEPAKYLFQDADFNERYCFYLDKFATSKYLESFFSSIEIELEEKIELIKMDKLDYEYKRRAIFKTARRIESAMQPSDEISLQAYTLKGNTSQKTIKVTNFHALPLIIIGSSTNKKQIIPILQPAFINSNRRSKSHEYSNLMIPPEHHYIHYKVAGIDSLYYSTIKKWAQPTAAINPTSSSQSLQVPLDTSDYVRTAELIKIKSGKYNLTKPLLIPAHIKLVIEAGTELDLTNNAYLLSYGPVILSGTEGKPILIHSSDKSAQGVHILNAKEKSNFAYVQFENLNTLAESHWQLTGAVTIHESEVALTHVTISANLCEDALNIIRSDFTADRLHINNTFADGFDADFCHGTIKNSRFINTGNDGVDFSGSTINMTSLFFENIGDKAISAGEQATVEAKEIIIHKAEIGVASKDLSKVTIDNITLSECNKGFVAFQKKPEFGPATIKVTQLQTDNLTFLQIAETNSVIDLPQSK